MHGNGFKLCLTKPRKEGINYRRKKKAQCQIEMVFPKKILKLIKLLIRYKSPTKKLYQKMNNLLLEKIKYVIILGWSILRKWISSGTCHVPLNFERFNSFVLYMFCYSNESNHDINLILLVIFIYSRSTMPKENNKKKHLSLSIPAFVFQVKHFAVWCILVL